MFNTVKIEEIGKKIKSARVRKYWSRQRLEKESGVKSSAIHMLENNKLKDVGILKLIKLCRALDINPIDFFREV